MSNFIHEHRIPTRENFIITQGLPNIIYFTESEQQQFIKTNGGQWDGQSFCGSNPIYPDGNCTHNALKQIQNSYALHLTPLLIPKKENYQKWSTIQLQALAMQGIQVKEKNSKNYTDFRGTTTFNPNVAYYDYTAVGSLRQDGETISYYERFLQEYPKLQKKPESVFQSAISEPAPVTITEPLLPEVSILPEVYAEPTPTLSPKIKKIIDDWSVKKIIVPAWFANNNMNWVLEGKITEQEFLDAYTHLVNTGGITFIKEPEPVVGQVSTNMISQELVNFTIVNNRIQGSIRFIATDLFNPYYFNKEITNYLQLKSNDKIIHIKPNRLRFTETERDELINFNEYAFNLDSINAESFVWTGTDLAMSNTLQFTIEPGKETQVTTGTTGLMGAGVLGLIGILMLGGFIADHVRKRK